MKRPSLRRRLLWGIGLPVIILWLVAGAWLAQRTAHETGEMFDRELERTAASVLVLAAAAPAPPAAVGAPPPSVHRHKRGQRPEIVIRDRAGRVLLDASTLPAEPDFGGKQHFRTIRHAHETWRVYQRWDAGHRYWVQVAAPLHDREQLRTAQVQALLFPVAGLLLLLPLAIWLGLRGGLAPLRAVSRALAARPAQTPTLTRDDVPTELLQLTRTVDALVADLGAALARERRFTADAAHELRHPLSVLRMELDLAAVAYDVPERNTHLARARTGLARMERLVSQLLTLARVESLDEVADAAPLDAAALARTVIAEAGEHAAPRGIGLSLDADPTATIHASPGLIGIALRNLVDNAISHGKPNGEVDVRVTRQDGTVELAVADDGPGIPADKVAHVGERFVRGADSHGSGLGLSIVEAIVTLHGGRITVGRSEAGGARVTLHLPAVAPATDANGKC